jgi:hypothetical protein
MTGLQVWKDKLSSIQHVIKSYTEQFKVKLDKILLSHQIRNYQKLEHNSRPTK